MELLLILFSIHSYYFRLIHGLIASFLAFCSAHGSWPMGAGPAPVPGGGPKVRFVVVISLVFVTFVTRGCGPPPPPLEYADLHNGFVVGLPPLPPQQKPLSLCQEATLLCDLPSPGNESCTFVQSLPFGLLWSDHGVI